MRLPILSEEAFNALDRWALLSKCEKERDQWGQIRCLFDPGSRIRDPE
jgi:hypothetical protein